MSVVNLLDMRDDEESKATSRGGGNRWAAQNPKAKAKSNTRNRRRNKPQTPGDEGGASKGGFGRQRMNSQMSGLSQGSEYSEGEEEDTQGKASGAKSKEEAQQDVEAGGRKDKVEQDGNNEDGQKGSAVGFANIDSENGGELFSEARKVAQLRQLLKDESPGAQGPLFKQSVWEYYMVKASWSDGLCVALNHSNMYACCFVPCLWPYRLFLTIKRAAPLKIKMCKCCNCACNACCALPLATVIFMLPILAGLTFLPAVSTMLEEHVKNIPVLGESESAVLYTSIILVVLSCFLAVFWWARVLLGVGMKYNILEAMDKPDKFVCKAMFCICATNMRVGVHVDRAQGFEKVLKADRTTIELSDTMRMVSPPAQSVIV